MKSRYIDRKALEHLLAGMMPENALAIQISMDTGMRIGDVLSMPFNAPDSPYYTYSEEKTHKRRTVRLSDQHRNGLRAFRFGAYCFPHRLDPDRHRTRQAVYKDIKRIAKAFRLKGISPHSARKMYAVELYHKTGNVDYVRRRLNHEDTAVTLIYALADQLSIKRG